MSGLSRLLVALLILENSSCFPDISIGGLRLFSVSQSRIVDCLQHLDSSHSLFSTYLHRRPEHRLNATDEERQRLNVSCNATVSCLEEHPDFEHASFQLLVTAVRVPCEDVAFDLTDIGKCVRENRSIFLGIGSLKNGTCEISSSLKGNLESSFFSHCNITAKAELEENEDRLKLIACPIL